MTRNLLIAATGLALMAGPSFGADAQDPQVQERMQLMKTMAGNFGKIAQMVQGKTDFDAQVAADAKVAADEQASNIVVVFQPEATDPASEAKPEIWTNWDDFVVKANALEAALDGLDTSSLEAMKPGFGQVAKSCGGCHEVYREK